MQLLVRFSWKPQRFRYISITLPFFFITCSFSCLHKSFYFFFLHKTLPLLCLSQFVKPYSNYKFFLFFFIIFFFLNKDIPCQRCSDTDLPSACSETLDYFLFFILVTQNQPTVATSHYPVRWNKCHKITAPHFVILCLVTCVEFFWGCVLKVPVTTARLFFSLSMHILSLSLYLLMTPCHIRGKKRRHFLFPLTDLSKSLHVARDLAER